MQVQQWMVQCNLIHTYLDCVFVLHEYELLTWLHHHRFAIFYLFGSVVVGYTVYNKGMN